MKQIIPRLFVVILLLFSVSVRAQTCPFDEPNTQPEWINNITGQEKLIAGLGVASYDPKIHKDIFALRKFSETSAKQALAQNLRVSVYNSILSNKSLTNNVLIKKSQSVIEQVSELALPDSQVEARWLDKENCILWSKVIIGTQEVDEYVDEIGAMELEVNEHLDNSLASSVVELLNKKQFFLNYAGFSKAVNQQAILTFKGESRPVLSWMIDNGFDMFEPSLVSAGRAVEDGVGRYHNTNSFEYFMNGEELTSKKMSYILAAYKQSQQSYSELKTPVLSHEGSKMIYGSKNPGIKFNQGPYTHIVDAPFALGVRFVKDQPYFDVPKVKNIYSQKTELFTGKFSLLHLVTLYQRYDLVELLLKKGFAPNVKDVNDMTPAQYAVAIEDETLIKLFFNTQIKLDGIYATAVHKSIYVANNFLYQGHMRGEELSADMIKIYSQMGGVDYSSNILFKYKKIFKQKDKSNVKSSQKLLKQSIEALNAFWKGGKYSDPKDMYQPLTKEIFDKSVKRLNAMM